MIQTHVGGVVDKMYISKHLGLSCANINVANNFVESMFFSDSPVGPVTVYARRGRVFLRLNNKLLENYGLRMRGDVVVVFCVMPVVSFHGEYVLTGSSIWKCIPEFGSSPPLLVSSMGYILFDSDVTKGKHHNNRFYFSRGMFDYDVAYLVLCAFQGQSFGQRVVHKNGQADDNRNDNLRWGSGHEEVPHTT